MGDIADLRRASIREGVAAAFVGYVTGAVIYSLIDLALDHSLFFASRTLGADLVGAELAALHPILTIIAYDSVRLLILLGIGVTMSAAIHRSGRRPRLYQLALLGGVATLVLSEGALLILARPVSAVHFWWVVVTANLATGLAMGLYVGYRFLLRQLDEVAKVLR